MPNDETLVEMLRRNIKADQVWLAEFNRMKQALEARGGATSQVDVASALVAETEAQIVSAKQKLASLESEIPAGG